MSATITGSCTIRNIATETADPRKMPTEELRSRTDELHAARSALWWDAADEGRVSRTQMRFRRSGGLSEREKEMLGAMGEELEALTRELQRRARKPPDVRYAPGVYRLEWPGGSTDTVVVGAEGQHIETRRT